MLIEHLIIIDRTALLDTIMVLFINVIWTDFLVHLLTYNRRADLEFGTNDNHRKIHYNFTITHDANDNLGHYEMGTKLPIWGGYKLP